MDNKAGKPVKPWQIFAAVLLLNLFLGLVIITFPSGKIPITQDFSLKFISLEKLLNQERVVQKDITKIIEESDVLDTSSTVPEKIIKDSLYYSKLNIPNEKRIQYQDSTEQNALEQFFQALYETEKTGKLFRVAHYGDSQLEGDRFSDYLRNRFQLAFGGRGPGIVVPMDISNSRLSIRQSESADWLKLAAYGVLNKKLKSSMYGIGASVYRFTHTVKKLVDDSTDADVPDSLKVKKYSYSALPVSWLDFKRSNQTYKSSSTFSRVKVLYGNNPGYVPFELKAGNRLIVDSFPPAEQPALYPIDLSLADNGVHLNFTTPNSPDFYGIAFDGDSGIAWDNFSMRGSSGTEFVKMNAKLLRQQYDLLNTRFIVLQYGINVVPYAKEQQACDYYEKVFYAQLQYLKRVNPGISILVVGVSDMSMKDGNEFVSYPFVEGIRNAQKNAAFKAGCAFWDLYEAMGGKNSMASWVFNKTPLAAKDFTHFAPRGAHILSEMLFKALMADYEVWKSKTKMKL